MAGGGNAIRGSRVGAGPMGEAERGEAAPRQNVTYFCSHEHRTLIAFAVEATVPDTWDCPRCGLPASMDSRQPAAGPEDRALQDPPGLREGAPLRRRGQGHPQRGHRHPARRAARAATSSSDPPTGGLLPRCEPPTGLFVHGASGADRAVRVRRLRPGLCDVAPTAGLWTAERIRRPVILRAWTPTGSTTRGSPAAAGCPLPLDAPFTTGSGARPGRLAAGVRAAGAARARCAGPPRGVRRGAGARRPAHPRRGAGPGRTSRRRGDRPHRRLAARRRHPAALGAARSRRRSTSCTSTTPGSAGRRSTAADADSSRRTSRRPRRPGHHGAAHGARPRPAAVALRRARGDRRVPAHRGPARAADAEIGRFRGFRGVVQLRCLAPLGDGRAESPGESALRLHWYDAGLPTPEPSGGSTPTTASRRSARPRRPGCATARSTTARSSTHRPADQEYDAAAPAGSSDSAAGGSTCSRKDDVYAAGVVPVPAPGRARGGSAQHQPVDAAPAYD